MQIYRVRPDRTLYGRGFTGEARAAHKWILPGVRCPKCGATWATVGVEYPAVDLGLFAFEAEYRKARAEPLPEFQRLRSQLAEVVPSNCHLVPGAEFGPLVGKAWGKLADFVWRVPWTLMMRSEAVSRLAESGVRCPPTVETELKFRGKNAPSIVEFQIDLGPRLIFEGDAPPVCSACKRDGIQLPEDLVVDAEGVPADVDVFRASNYETVILATERFVKAVNDLALIGASFEDVGLIS